MQPPSPGHEPQLTSRARGALLGLAAGDAVGTTLEFKPRGAFAPLTDMVGGGPFGLAPGQWTDDTSMMLCLVHSLVQRRGMDLEDQLRRYLAWRDQGYMSCTGACFDIGDTVADALARFERTGDPHSGSADPWRAGNGSIMRLAPVAIFAWRDERQAQELAIQSSRTTHQAAEALQGCQLLAAALWRALRGQPLERVLDLSQLAPRAGAWTPGIQRILAQDYLRAQPEQLRGSGYVVHSLEAALWCVATTSSPEQAILQAANLGEDADTTAAVCGQLVGALYGQDALPTRWLERLAWRAQLSELADALLLAAP